MSKAILIIDEMPKNCGECKLYMNNGNSYWCKATGIDTTGFTIPASCPLKPMSQKKEIYYPTTNGITTLLEGEYTLNDYLHDKGWNDCIDEMLGGTHE